MHPNNLISILLASLLFASAQLQAEVLIDKKIDVRSAIIPLEKSIKDYAASRALGMFSDSIWVQNERMRGGNSVFGWTISKDKYLSAVAWYTSNLDPLPECDDASVNCKWIMDRHTVCHLFLFHADSLKLADVTPLQILRDDHLLKGKPRCQDVKAMALARVIPETMLVTLGYSDSAMPAEARSEPPEFITTVAVRITSEGGELRVEQQDNCLGNPNRYRTIAAARKRLAECASAGSRTGE